MTTAAGVGQFPAKAGQQGQVDFTSSFPIATGGLPINPIGTGIPTGTFPQPTGSLNGVPSGVPLYFRNSGEMQLSRKSAGLYTLNFSPAPNGTIFVWVEFAAGASSVQSIRQTKRDIATGYVELAPISASGTAIDFSNGDMVSAKYTAYSTGNPGG